MPTLLSPPASFPSAPFPSRTSHHHHHRSHRRSRTHPHHLLGKVVRLRGRRHACGGRSIQRLARPHRRRFRLDVADRPQAHRRHRRRQPARRRRHLVRATRVLRRPRRAHPARRLHPPRHRPRTRRLARRHLPAGLRAHATLPRPRLRAHLRAERRRVLLEQNRLSRSRPRSRTTAAHPRRVGRIFPPPHPPRSRHRRGPGHRLPPAGTQLVRLQLSRLV